MEARKNRFIFREVVFPGEYIEFYVGVKLYKGTIPVIIPFILRSVNSLRKLKQLRVARNLYPMRTLIIPTLCTLVLLFAGEANYAQVIRPFTPRFSVDAKGGIVFVSNNIITTKVSAGAVYTTLPPGCSSGSGTVCKNDGKQNTNIDIDGDASTFNSSSATLSLDACNSVAFAGLYWGAGIALNQDANGSHPMKSSAWNQIRFKVPGGSYQTVTASVIDTVKTVFEGYQAFADVTALVRAGGGGSYTVANVKCDSVNITNAYGGWTMVVVYNDLTQPLRNLTVFDGLAVVGTSGGGLYTTRDITVTGFKCPPEGTVAAKVGVVAYDGDRGAKDGFYVMANSNNTFIDQTNAGESADPVSNFQDCWNSAITSNGAVVTSRIPSHQNTYGYDAHIYALNNSGNKYLRNGDSSATIRVSTPSSGGEGYVFGLMTTEIDTYVPEIIMENTLSNLNGTTYKKEDTIMISSTLRNTGTDTATNARIVTKLASYFKYVPNSIVVDGVSRTDALNDDVAEYNASNTTITIRIGEGSTASAGGFIPNGNKEYTLSYKVTISSSCEDVGYSSRILMLQSSILYTDQLTGYSDSTASRPGSPSGCVLPIMPDTAYLSMGCDFALSVNPRPPSTSYRPVERNEGSPRFSPSPADAVTVLKGVKKAKKIEWFAINGRLVKTDYNLVSESPLNVSGLSAGFYVVKVYTEKEILVLKMIKN